MPPEIRGFVGISRCRVLLTVDQSDFSNLPADEHPDIIIITDMTQTGGEIRRAVRRIERSVSDLSDYVAYVSDWL